MIGNPATRSRRGARHINRAPAPLLAIGLPYVSILLASLLAFPIAADTIALAPPLGFLVLLGWRLVRPGLLPIWTVPLLGGFDDLFSGQPLGSAIMLWTAIALLLDLVDRRFPWRGFWQDWLTAGLAITIYIVLALIFSGSRLTPYLFQPMAIQILLSILLYPTIARLVAWLDRMRLAPIRTLN